MKAKDIAAERLKRNKEGDSISFFQEGDKVTVYLRPVQGNPPVYYNATFLWAYEDGLWFLTEGGIMCYTNEPHTIFLTDTEDEEEQNKD